MKLEYIRIYNFRLIPDRLFEAKGAEYDSEYLRGPVAESPLDDHNTVLYGLYDDKSVIHGILWISYSLMTHKLWVNLFSVDKEYQDSNNMETAMEHIRKNCKIQGITTVNVVTTRYKAFEKYGAKKSKLVNMEIELWEKEVAQIKQPS